MTSTLPTTSSRHLTLVTGAAIADAEQRLSRLEARAATNDMPTVPATVLEHLADLDAEHATALDLQEMATRELEAARDTLTAAAQALTVAEAAWQDAGSRCYDTGRALAEAREAAGLVWTAGGYQPKGWNR
jgi:hypothetical protein